MKLSTRLDLEGQLISSIDTVSDIEDVINYFFNPFCLEMFLDFLKATKYEIRRAMDRLSGRHINTLEISKMEEEIINRLEDEFPSINFEYIEFKIGVDEDMIGNQLTYSFNHVKMIKSLLDSDLSINNLR